MLMAWRLVDLRRSVSGQSHATSNFTNWLTVCSKVYQCKQQRNHIKYLQYRSLPGAIVPVGIPAQRASHVVSVSIPWRHHVYHRADSRLAPSQWETSLQSNVVSHWLGAKLESSLYHIHIGNNPSNYIQIIFFWTWTKIFTNTMINNSWNISLCYCKNEIQT